MRGNVDTRLRRCEEGAVDAIVLAAAAAVASEETTLTVAAERGVMAAVHGSCQLPVAAHAVRRGDRLQLDGFLAEPDGTRPRRLTVDVPYPTSVDEARRVGFALGAELASA